MKSLFLVGFMASGKTTVGPVLAARLGVPFTDLDRLIEAESGTTIAAIIGREGEESFRRLETATLRTVIAAAPGVIAPGGGAITRVENRELMAGHGTVIWLDAPFELCWERIGADKVVRPLASDEASARARYEQRQPLYREARLRIPITAELSPDDIVRLIIESLATL
ncbi:MAG: shikimate kinase [Acidobacteriota bacterium]